METRFDLLVEQMAEREGVTEWLKAQDQMLWARKMNNIRARRKGRNYFLSINEIFIRENM